MEAVISGQAGVALLVDGSALSSIHVHDPDTVVARRAGEFHYLFGGASDLVFVEGVSPDDVREELQAAADGEDVTQLTLLLLASDRSEEIRQLAAEELSELLAANPQAAAFAERLLLSTELPQELDLAGALQLCTDRPVRDFLVRLERLQPYVRLTQEAWHAIPEDVFGDSSEDCRTTADAIFVREGVVRQFVLAAAGEADLQTALSTALQLPAVRSLPNHGKIVTRWKTNLTVAEETARSPGVNEMLAVDVTLHRSGRLGMRDFFISYSLNDQQWAEWIAWQFEEQGHTTIIQAWDFRPGSNFVVDMQKAAQDARRTIAVLSPDFLESRFTQTEWAAAFAKDPTGENTLLLPVRVRECDLAGLLPQIVYIDLVNKDEATAKADLLAGIERERAKPTEPPAFPATTSVAIPDAQRTVIVQPRFPGSLPLVWNVPHERNPNFTGREELLAKLRSALNSGQPAALTQAIHGLGGVGKTQMAVEYAYRHAADYDYVWWVRAEEPATRAADLAALAEPLKLPEMDAQAQSEIVAAVRSCLSRHPGWLLVFDNVPHPDDLKGLLPSGGTGHIIVTSRDPNWLGRATPLRVELFDRPVSIEFLLRRTGVGSGRRQPADRTDVGGGSPDATPMRDLRSSGEGGDLRSSEMIGSGDRSQQDTAGELAERLGDLPLALAQAAAYIEKTGMPLRDYLELLDGRREELWADHHPPEGYERTVAETFSLTIERVRTESPSAEALLNLCAYLAPDGIPLLLLTERAEHLPKMLKQCVRQPVQLNRSIAVLRSYSLVERSGNLLSIHRLVRAVCKDRLIKQPAARAWDEAAECIEEELRRPERLGLNFGERRKSVTRLEQRLHQLESSQDAESHWGIWKRWKILNQLGQAREGLAQLSDALDCHVRALKLAKRVVTSENQVDLTCQATTYYELGVTSKQLARFDDARRYLQKSVRIAKLCYGRGHQKLARRWNRLGDVYRDLGNLSKAMRYYQRALRIEKAECGPNDTKTIRHLVDIAIIERERGKLEDAQRLLEQARHIDEVAFTAQHPYVADCLCELSLVLMRRGELNQAEALMRRALDIDKQSYGEEHPKFARDLNNLARLLQAKTRLAEAELLMRRSLAIDEQSYGAEHPNVARDLINLARLLQDTNRLAEAEPMMRRALKVFEVSLGPEHPNTHTVAENLRLLLAAMQKGK